MRKVTHAAIALLLILSLSCTAFAANSITYAAEVNTAKDASGNTVEVTTKTSTVQMTQDQAETLLQAAGVSQDKTVSVAFLADVSVPEGTQFPVDITFDVAGVTTGMDVVVYHFSAEKNEWEAMPTTVANGNVTATFTSLSPVAVLVAADGAEGEGTVTSPKTGESNLVYYVGAAALIAGAGTLLVVRKKHA